MAESQSKAQEYRETAAKLREMADGMKSEDARAQLVELADQFDRLAERAARRQAGPTWIRGGRERLPVNSAPFPCCAPLAGAVFLCSISARITSILRRRWGLGPLIRREQIG